MELRWLRAEPGEGPRELRMGAELPGRVPFPRQLGFGEDRVDLVVADLMDEDGGPVGAALHLRDEVMDALARARRDGPEAQRAERIAGGGVGVLIGGGHGGRG